MIKLWLSIIVAIWLTYPGSFVLSWAKSVAVVWIQCLMKTGPLDEETKQTSIRCTIELWGMPMPYDEKQRQAAWRDVNKHSLRIGACRGVSGQKRPLSTQQVQEMDSECNVGWVALGNSTAPATFYHSSPIQYVGLILITQILTRFMWAK